MRSVTSSEDGGNGAGTGGGLTDEVVSVVITTMELPCNPQYDRRVLKVCHGGRGHNNRPGLSFAFA